MNAPIKSGGEAVPVSLNLNLSAMSIHELVTVYKGMRHLSMTLSGLIEMPRSYAADREYNKAGEAFETLADAIENEWSKVIDEIISRTPADSHERCQRDFAIVDHHINETSPMELNLAMASEQIGSREEVPIDPLVEAIRALRVGDAAYSAQSGEDDEAIEATYGPPFRALSEWDQPATSMAGVREAVRLTVEHGGICCPAATAALTAALAYLDREAQS